MQFPLTLKSCTYYAAIFLFISTFSFSLPALSQATVQQEHILVLYDSAALTPWKNSYSDALLSNLAGMQGPLSNSIIYYEYLGLQGPRSDELIAYLKYKQQVSPASIVISTLTLTANLLFDEGDSIYPQAKKLYVLPSQQTQDAVVAKGDPNSKILQSIYGRSIRKTLEVMEQSVPMLENIYIISGQSNLELEFLKVAQGYLANRQSVIETHFLTGLTPAEILSEVTEFKANSAIMVMMYQEDRLGHRYKTTDITSRLLNLASAPIFTPFDVAYIDGVIGGNFNNTQATADATWDIIKAMTENQPIDTVSTTDSQYIFDQQQLQRWGIDETLLPAGSLVLNRNLNFIELYPRELFTLIIALVALIALIMHLKIKEGILKRQKTLFESVISSISDAILLTDTDDKIFALNSSAATLFGLSSSQLLGLKSNTLLHQDTQINDSLLIASTASPDDSKPRLSIYTKSNGSNFYGETLSKEIITEDGEVLGNFALIRDVSKRLSEEEEHRQGQKMEALGNLAGGIAHDFNNILGVIIGYTELSLVEKTPQSPRANLKSILKATSRAKSLINQIMTFSRDSKVDQKPIDLAKTLNETLKMIRVSIPNHTKLITNIERHGKPIFGVKIQIQQIIMNLTTNAYQAIPDTGGIIEVSLTRLFCKADTHLSHGVLIPGNYSVLCVKDNGSGMDTKTATRIFEPSFTTKHSAQGSGMGLAILYKLIKNHGAILDLSTELKLGTCIKIYFKEVDADIPLRPDKEPLSSIKGNNRHILLVDDEIDLLYPMTNLLTNIGFKVTAFGEPIKAIAYAKRHPEVFDIIFTDQKMPNTTGIQLIKEIRKFCPQLPAIICTGYSEELYKSQITDLDSLTILKKPSSIEEISHSIDAVLQKNQSLSLPIPPS